jgi:hypothetical protein
MFVGKLSGNLQIPSDYIEIGSLRVGSVIVDYSIFPPPEDIQTVNQKQNQLLSSGLMDLGYPLIEYEVKFTGAPQLDQSNDPSS